MSELVYICAGIALWVMASIALWVMTLGIVWLVGDYCKLRREQKKRLSEPWRRSPGGHSSA